MSLLISILAALFVGYFIWRFFTSRWQEVFITQDVEQFMSISEALQNAGIRFKSTTGGQEFNGRRSAKADNLPSISYSILVNEDKAYLAQQKINETLFGTMD